jgi:glycosidase
MSRLTLSLIVLLSSVSLYAAGGCWEENDASPLGPIELNEQGEFVPEWAKKVVWYQIFPERFRNGDPSNDPTMVSILGADPQEPPKHWQIHPWGSDWYELQDYEKANGEPELWKHILRRRYGGDLQGILDKLDYLKELGISAIYLNPVFHSPSHHKYDGISYHHIDPYFGPDPEADLALIAQENPLNPETWVWTAADKLALKLIAEAHKRDIKIIFDGVFNHLGINSFAFQDLLKNQAKSPYKDWFIVKSFDDPAKGTRFDYAGWFGVKSLPEFKEDMNGLVQGPRDYVFAATERWMNPMGKGAEYGIDGWRLDVAFCVSHRFWKDWRTHVKQLNPQAYITAEIVAPVEKLIPFFQGDEFDAEMNYNFAFTAAEFFFNPEGKERISVTEFDQKLKELRNVYPKGVSYVTMNLFGSHDSNRLASHIVNRGIGNYRDWGNYFNTSIAMRNPAYQVRKPDAFERQLQKLFVLFQMTYVGAPMVYYGDEVGMWGGNDPSTRKPMLWPDIDHDDEIYNPDGTKRTADKVAVDVELKNFYQRLILLRNEHQALQLGTFTPIPMSDADGIYAYERAYGKERIQVFLNNSGKAKRYIVPNNKTSPATILYGDQPDVGEHYISITLKPYDGLVVALDGSYDFIPPRRDD